MYRLHELNEKVGQSKLVIDLSCRKLNQDYFVVTNRWQTFTDTRINAETLDQLANYCDEFLIHGVDVEGLSEGIDETLVQLIADYSPISATYAGGARSLADLYRVSEIGKERVHLTIGSALDIFGGSGVKYSDAVKFNQEQTKD